MKETKEKTITLDDDTLIITFVYDADTDRYYGEYPDFKEFPRYTPNGRPWVNVTDEDCPYFKDGCGDCGSCPYLSKANQKDLIGICLHESNKRGLNEPKPNKVEIERRINDL